MTVLNRSLPTSGTDTRSTSSAPARRVPAPRTWGIGERGVLLFGLGNLLLILLMWLRHGGLEQLGTLGGTLSAIGQVTALTGTFLVLAQITLMSRSPWLTQIFGVGGLVKYHRWLGFTSVTLIGAHLVFTTLGYALLAQAGPVAEFVTLMLQFPYVLMATVAFGLMVAVAVTSIRRARRRFAYETWYGIHLYAYIAIALGFMHQLVVGSDFMGDAIARIYWIALYVVVAALIVVFRIGQPIATSLAHDLRVAAIEPESDDTYSLYLSGRDLDRLAVSSGQYFHLRFLTNDGWWRSHPFSISEAPTGTRLRFTIKELGDFSRRIRTMRPGTRVWVEGPYGNLTARQQHTNAALLVGGGIGITPIRALLEELPIDGRAITLLFRASNHDELILRDELDALAAARGATVHYLVGKRGSAAMPSDPLAPDALGRLVPDIRNRDIYICGSVGLIDAVHDSARHLGVPARQIHEERFSF